jgi:hypothetical protein
MTDALLGVGVKAALSREARVAGDHMVIGVVTGAAVHLKIVRRVSALTVTAKFAFSGFTSMVTQVSGSQYRSFGTALPSI